MMFLKFWVILVLHLRVCRSKVVWIGRWSAEGIWSSCEAEQDISCMVRSVLQKMRSSVVHVRWLSNWNMVVPSGS